MHFEPFQLATRVFDAIGCVVMELFSRSMRYLNASLNLVTVFFIYCEENCWLIANNETHLGYSHSMQLPGW